MSEVTRYKLMSGERNENHRPVSLRTFATHKALLTYFTATRKVVVVSVRWLAHVEG